MKRLWPGNVAPLLAAAALALALTAHHESALAKGAAAPPTATPAATPPPTPTPEPANVAIPRLEAKLKADPTNVDTMMELAPYYMEANRPDLARQLTQKAIAGGRKTAQAYYIDGVAAEQLGDVKGATYSLEQAANYEPTNDQVLLALVDLYVKTNRVADAEKVAKRAATFNKDDKRALLTYALVLSQLGKYDDARTQLETAAKLDPKDATAVVLEGRSYMEQKAFASAIQVFDRALQIDPKSVDALQGKAVAYAQLHDIKNAIASYDQIYAIAPDDTSRVSILGAEAGLYSTEKMPSDAEAVLKKAVAQFPSVPAAHIQYGDFLISQNRPKDAEAEWLAAAGPNNDNRDALMRLGALYMSQNQAQKAIDRFKRAAETNPGDADALIRLAQAYTATQQFSQAHDAYRRSFEAQRSVVSLTGIGVSDCALKNFKEATQVFDVLDKNAGDFLKQNPQLYLVMGRCYADANQKDKAKSAYTRLLAYTKAGSPEQSQVKKMIADLNRQAKPTPSPKH